MKNKYPPILDVTCGGRMMWFDHNNPLCLYVDKRELPPTDFGEGRLFEVKPDMIADFRHLPFLDGTFHLVVFDPPHLIRVSDKAYLKIKFERLSDTWQADLKAGFDECMRVLADYGTLIFKWSEIQIPTKKVIEAIGHKPLFGHISGRQSKTHWLAFMKTPNWTYED